LAPESSAQGESVMLVVCGKAAGPKKSIRF
jgi:hypothetical protein